MGKIFSDLKEQIRDKYITSLFFILLISFFLRFYDFGRRWGLGYDQARDAIVTYESLQRIALPLSGPFSASGQFVFSPLWYWFHTGVTFLNPSSTIWLWVFQASLSALMPVVMYFVGKEIKDKNLGLLMAVITAVSTAQVAQATNLTYSTFVGFISMILALFLVKALKHGKLHFYFLTSLFIGLSLNIHFQAAGNILLLFILLFLQRKSLKSVGLIIVGFLIPFIPIILFDFLSNHFQSTHILEYLSAEKYSLPKRWLTYVFEFWPNAYSHIIGGRQWVGFISAALIGVVIAGSVLKKNISKPLLIVIVFVFVNFVALRYHKGPTYDAFIVYLHPYLIILTGWMIYSVYSYKKLLGILIFFVIIIFSLLKDYEEINYPSGLRANASMDYMYLLTNKYPDEKFAIYDYSYKTSDKSLPLVMFMMRKKLTSDDGIKIGFKETTGSAEMVDSIGGRIGGAENFVLLDLSSFEKEELEQMGWEFVNPSGVYDSVVDWWRK